MACIICKRTEQEILDTNKEALTRSKNGSVFMCPDCREIFNEIINDCIEYQLHPMNEGIISNHLLDCIDEMLDEKLGNKE